LAGQLAEAGQVDAAIEVVRNQLLRTLRRQDFQDWMVARLSASDRHAEAVQLAEVLLDNVIAVLRQPAQFRGAEWQKELRDDERILYPDSFEADALHNRLANLRLRLVTSLFVAENYRRASELLNEWLEATNDPPTRFLYLRTLAAVEQAEGREEAAGGTMERALLLRPTDVGLNNDLSYTWIDRGVRLTDAETMIRFAVGRAPAHAAYLDTFGWLHYKKGDLIEAKKWLKRASFARRKEDPVIMDHLGDCAWRLGEKGEAIGYWNKAIELLNERPEDETANADERRAKREAPKKVEDASAGRSPQVAPLGEAPAPATVPDGKEKSKSSG
jgi:Tfp pilus assembly protein PilF